MMTHRMARKTRRPATLPLQPAFDVRAVLAAASFAPTEKSYATGEVIFSQGDSATDVVYLQQGAVKLSVLSRTGKEAIVAMLGPGDFFGEGCLAAQERRMSTASAMSATIVLLIDKTQMLTLLHEQQSFADQFLLHMLARNIRIEEDLVDRLFNSSEKRLARILLLLARYNKTDGLVLIPKLSEETLAEMVGTTRSRLNFFMNKFRDLGFIDYNGDIKVHKSLVTVVLHD